MSADAAQKLKDVLRSIRLDANIGAFLKDDPSIKIFATANLRLAIWAKQFETIDKGNPALSFAREMQFANQQIVVLTAGAMYRSAAAAMRNMLEAALYYSYFRSHPFELQTLVRDTTYFVDKKEIIDFHKQHSPKFSKLQEALGLTGKLDKWYSSVSAIIHGQIPGAWMNFGALKDIKHDINVQNLVREKFIEGEDIVHKFFLCTIGQEMWADMSTSAKQHLLKGLSGEQKATLGLDLA